jgi:alkylhydroperoxidase family enzyme
MARVTLINRPEHYPGTPDEATKADIAALFAALFPGEADPEINQFHAGVAIAAHNPKLALNLARMSGLIAGELGWCQRKDLRELAIQALNLHYRSDYSFRSRMATATACGISAEQQAALPDWRGSTLFDGEQRLTIEYAEAVVTGDVPEELFARVKAQWGEQGAVECTALIGFWAFWAMFLNATGASMD